MVRRCAHNESAQPRNKEQTAFRFLSLSASLPVPSGACYLYCTKEAIDEKKKVPSGACIVIAKGRKSVLEAVFTFEKFLQRPFLIFLFSATALSAHCFRREPTFSQWAHTEPQPGLTKTQISKRNFESADTPKHLPGTCIVSECFFLMPFPAHAAIGLRKDSSAVCFFLLTLALAYLMLWFGIVFCAFCCLLLFYVVFCSLLFSLLVFGCLFSDR